MVEILRNFEIVPHVIGHHIGFVPIKAILANQEGFIRGAWNIENITVGIPEWQYKFINGTVFKYSRGIWTVCSQVQIRYSGLERHPVYSRLIPHEIPEEFLHSPLDQHNIIDLLNITGLNEMFILFIILFILFILFIYIIYKILKIFNFKLNLSLILIHSIIFFFYIYIFITTFNCINILAIILTLGNTLKLYNNFMFYLFIILFFVCWVFLCIIINSKINKAKFDNKYKRHTLIKLIAATIIITILIIFIFLSIKIFNFDFIEFINNIFLDLLTILFLIFKS